MSTKVMYHYFALKNAQKQLVSGVTCVRDCWSAPEWGPSLRRVLNQGVFAGPRLLVANLGITQWGNQEGIGPEWALKEDRETDEVPTGIYGMKHAVRERKHSGSDFIKIATTGGIIHGVDSRLRTSLFMDEEILAITEEAHRLGMHVACHAYGVEGIQKAVEGGVDTLEHGIFINEEIADLMIQKGTYLIPTQVAMKSPPEALEKFPPEVVKKEKEVSEAMIPNHRLAFEKGVLIAVGTDSGAPVIPHSSTAKEIQNMVENVGMTPSQALQAATIHGARAIKRDDEIGSIEKGKYGDIVICDRNPLEDLSILENPKNIAYVIKDGKIMVRQGKIVYFS
ncbi:MAG: metal-dependent hydrolase family protein [Candidatus Hodarchaeales archaeon]